MDTIKTIEEIYKIEKSVITIGNFDGLHKGHRVLINKTVQVAKENNYKSIVFTFSNHPANYFSPGTIKNIVTNERKLELLKEMGVDIVINIVFDEFMTTITAQEFVKDLLVEKLGVKKLVVGHDFTFARKKEGNGKLLKELSKTYNFDVEIIEPIKIDNTRISSTYIRQLIKEGRINEVNHYLGYNYSIEGEVIKCRQLGRTIGFPTANIRLNEDMVLPKVGIYSTTVYLNNKSYIGATNVGYNPTVNGQHLSIETHILNFNEEIYGQTLRLEFLDRIRDEKKFNSLDELKQQLEKDTNYISKNYICKI